MKTQSSFFPPPRVADWLINLFAAPKEAESMLGDLHEEFSQLASHSEIAFARRWYWRQTVATIAHLFGAGFRIAPWSTSAAVVGGFLLGSLFHGLLDKLLSVVTDRYLMYWSAHFKAYMFFATDGMLIANLLSSMFVGCVVALAAKGREMVATVSLALVLCAMVATALPSLIMHWPSGEVIPWVLFQCSGPFAMVIGSALVRMRRAATANLPTVA
jgi:hypothetical protein